MTSDELDKSHGGKDRSSLMKGRGGGELENLTYLARRACGTNAYACSYPAFELIELELIAVFLIFFFVQTYPTFELVRLELIQVGLFYESISCNSRFCDRFMSFFSL